MFQWYNEEHHHDSLALFTPGDVFEGRVEDVAQQRQHALLAAYTAHPERFVAGCPKVKRPPESVAISPADGVTAPTAEQTIDTPNERLEEVWPGPGDSSDVTVIHVPGTVKPEIQAELAT